MEFLKIFGKQAEECNCETDGVEEQHKEECKHEAVEWKCEADEAEEWY